MKKLKSLLQRIFNVRFSKEFVCFLISFSLFLALAIFINSKGNEVNVVDASIRDFAYQIRGEKNGPFYYVARSITELGFVYAIIPIFFVFLMFTRLDLRSLILGFGSLFSYFCNSLSKLIINRERPILENRWMNESSSSFPSGHSMTAMFFYGMLIYFVFKSCRTTKKQKTIVISITSLLILLIGLSRIIIGVHYFTDVLGGFLFGLALVSVFIIIYNLLNDDGYTFLQKRLYKENIWSY